MSLIRAVDPRFEALFAPDAAFEVLAEGFAFTEGATWHFSGEHVTFTDIPNSRIHRWFAGSGETVVLREPSGMTNGTTFDREGRLLMCEHATSRVSRLEPDGSLSVLAERWQGAELNSPNDIVVDDAGAIWFTDPLYGREPETGVKREPGQPFCGLYRIAPDGALELVADDFAAPNGLCFSPDKARLYVNDSERKHIRVFDIDRRGGASGGAVFAETRDPDGTLGAGSPDGMKVDAAGNVWCAGQGGIHVFDQGGSLLGVLLTPQFPANFCFGGDDLCMLFVCAGTTFVRIGLAQPGHDIFNPR
ncbi:MAG: SMP-30/gluconolactonase/LRE family protein [Proteobacteria bacterium]|nr:SMP-30/gluconolactonase/LRE family protein [Pseudomonadota bacterium]